MPPEEGSDSTADGEKEKASGSPVKIQRNETGWQSWALRGLSEAALAAFEVLPCRDIAWDARPAVTTALADSRGAGNLTSPPSSLATGHAAHARSAQANAPPIFRELDFNVSAGGKDSDTGDVPAGVSRGMPCSGRYADVRWRAHRTSPHLLPSCFYFMTRTCTPSMGSLWDTRVAIMTHASSAPSRLDRVSLACGARSSCGTTSPALRETESQRLEQGLEACSRRRLERGRARGA